MSTPPRSPIRGAGRDATPAEPRKPAPSTVNRWRLIVFAIAMGVLIIAASHPAYP
ncbi:hypothetical protein [Streptomyces sp. NPDC046985]|uniref:hypothetical protein n=1 Tax=Streptomyces sp. NPDC046985 TaxID=3155377 RepID=UPI0033DA601A